MTGAHNMLTRSLKSLILSCSRFLFQWHWPTAEVNLSQFYSHIWSDQWNLRQVSSEQGWRPSLSNALSRPGNLEHGQIHEHNKTLTHPRHCFTGMVFSHTEFSCLWSLTTCLSTIWVFCTFERNEYKGYRITKLQASAESAVLPPTGPVTHGKLTTPVSELPSIQNRALA